MEKSFDEKSLVGETSKDVSISLQVSEEFKIDEKNPFEMGRNSGF
jgi:hypothetical protein